ncbi:SIR2 family NAD-dependent protein deacylase [Lysobacter sp. CA196]|uniref:SIR2 family NAD-dependent protein deacylase n=1 Tax=Lysobacter sp. CA196 TaxID=3455606 RepID=UPI003F8D08E1
MDYQHALAYAAASGALCLFTGAGFSKHLSGGMSPSWIELLEESCNSLINPAAAKAQLVQAAATYPLEDCAQILDIAFVRESKDLRETLAQLIGQVALHEPSAIVTRDFLRDNPSTTVVTTNYDRLLEQVLAADPCVSNFPGKPIARRSGAVQIFHIHGSIEGAASIVATTSDYYKFINEDGYFAQKTLTLMHESSVVILGYSLSDPNLKAILSDLKAHGARSLNRGNIFYVTRGVVPPFVRDYYEAAFGLVVIENMEIDRLLSEVAYCIPAARVQVAQSEQDIRDVISGRRDWADQFLRLPSSLFQILAVANISGTEIRAPAFAAMLGRIFERKIRYTNVNGAWEQYSHLADWLVHVGAIIDIRGTPLEESYLSAVRHSMTSMSSAYVRGKSWYAYSVWKDKWKFISFDNRLLIRSYVQANFPAHVDALAVVGQ